MAVECSIIRIAQSKSDHEQVYPEGLLHPDVRLQRFSRLTLQVPGKADQQVGHLRLSCLRLSLPLGAAMACGWI